MLKAIPLAGSLILTLSISTALAGPIEDRQAKMKTVGKSIGTVAKMAKGESDFDAQAALQAFVDMKNAADGFEELFPDGTESGKTEAGPKIFSDRAGFNAKQATFEDVLVKVTAAAPADIGALRASLGQVGAQCKACHTDYRVKK
jgi:cytochrome c556